MPRRRDQRLHYDELVRTRRPTRHGLSCGFADRFDPALLERRPLLRRAWARLLDRLLPDRVGTLVDVGCGTAYYWPLLRGRCERLVGVDLSPAMAAEGLRHGVAAPGAGGEALLVAGEASRLPLAAGSADAALAVDALHHADDLDRLVAELARVLRPGGRLVAVEPNVGNPVVFLAHLIPSEERGALWPSHPAATARALRRHLTEVRVEPVTYVSGLGWEPALRLVEAADPLLRLPPLSALALRRVYLARRAP